MRTPSTQNDRLVRQTGAVGLLSRQTDLAALQTIIREVGAGRTPCGLEESSLEIPTTAQLGSLTERERDILHLISAGLANNGIADKLGISANTVRTHVQNILAKLGVSNRLAASALARQAGLLDDSTQPLQMLS